MERIGSEVRLARLKTSVVAAVDSRQKELMEMSLAIHANPELLFQEYKSSRLLADYLIENGFMVEYPAFGLETAFKATIGEGRPKIGIMAEYDAIPEVGHGCGHNIIATAAAGAGIALASIIGELGGQVIIYGTPAEEGGNGKELMAKKGAFDDLDAAMMIHPWNSDYLYNNTYALSDLIKVEYFGKESHGSQPEKGINALDAMLIGFHAYKIQQPLLPYHYCPGIILEAGTWIATVPGHTMAHLLVPARNDRELSAALGRVKACFEAGAVATGARMEFHHDWERRYKATYVNRAIADCFDMNIRPIRPDWNPPPPFQGPEVATTDMGSVSQIAPSIHVWIAITSPDVNFHTLESAAATISEEGHKAMLDSAKAMAMTTADLIMKPDILAKAKKEFAAIDSRAVVSGTTAD
jgi:amidohydrolase